MPVNKSNANSTNKTQPKQQKGWIAIEVMLCLLLFAVVLHLAQRQTHAQWHSVQQLERQKKQQENTQKQQAMQQLIGNVAWLEEDESVKRAYPRCQQCTGDEFKNWFYAIQHNTAPLQQGAP
ncbi:hypothetical protein HGG82_12435 [Marinomonas sp. M1K-6]|uniref:Uncharacterized protein n=1 Tax=Marinomonas profundi TaxID=2726122 RepID=A0A847R3F0_9GAMM|nr:hypothetical protein [Marinomonas profundi]NLQ18422.1 hypothetical protein [Marinomonas profundi]UDV02476.1 hypothetical protein J8N69_12890 [Marinomonas profundi]